MIALREGLTMETFGDGEGYCCILVGLDNEGRPFRLVLPRPSVDRLMAYCDDARREHDEMVAPERDEND